MSRMLHPSTMRGYLLAGIRELQHRSNRVIAEIGSPVTDRQEKVLRKAELILELVAKLDILDE